MSEQVELVKFDVRVGLSDSIRPNVEHALSLGLPELRDFEYPYPGKLKVIANGPSARQADLGGTTLALNGALGLFVEQGRSPAYWAACDPNALVADFLTDPPPLTTYYVCSRCHPSVFEALSNRDVVLWHLDEPDTRDLLQDRIRIKTACSITILSFELFEKVGYRAFETWGWDGCKMDGQENAVPQFNGYVDKTIILGDRRFASTVTWGLELQDAWNHLGNFRWPIDIKGDGLFANVFPVMRQALEQARAQAVDTDPLRTTANGGSVTAAT